MTVQKPCASSDVASTGNSGGFNERGAACWEGYSNVYDVQLREFEATVTERQKNLTENALEDERHANAVKTVQMLQTTFVFAVGIVVLAPMLWNEFKNRSVLPIESANSEFLFLGGGASFLYMNFPIFLILSQNCQNLCF